MSYKPKVLIWNSYKLEPKGGPAGYLYNIHEYIKSEKINEIDFLNDYSDSRQSKTSLFIKKILKNIAPDYHKRYSLKLWIDNILKKKNFNLDINLDKYDFIHFHSTWELFKNRELLNNYNGKILLTSHSPKVFHKELTEDLFNLSYKKVDKEKSVILENIDTYSFSRADYVIFPCEFSEEPYRNSWNEYDNIVNREKVKYIPTSIKKIEKKNNGDFIRKKNEIGKNDIVISYVGRHNLVKGYDLIKKFAKKIWKKQDVYFLIAGNEAPLKGLEDKRWIEIGWTKDPHSIIEASDVFILPNRQTYFDLILLEVLSLNKPVLLSETGGNKHFKKFSKSNLYYFQKSNIDSMIKQFENFLNDQNDNNLLLNERIFNNNFTLDIFIDRYFELLRELKG